MSLPLPSDHRSVSLKRGHSEIEDKDENTAENICCMIKRIKIQAVPAEIGKEIVTNMKDSVGFFEDLLISSPDLFLENLRLPDSFHQLSCETKNDILEKFQGFFEFLPENRYIIRNTSNQNYLKEPIHKVDLALLDGNEVWWTHVVSGIYVVKNLTCITDYYKNIGRLSDMFRETLQQQPARKFIVGAVCDATQIELLWQDRNHNIQRSGLLPFSFSKPTPGLRMLMKMVIAPYDQLGYIPLENYKAAVVPFSSFNYKNFLASKGQDSFVLAGELNGESVVLKVSDIDLECKVLEGLSDLQYIPKIVHQGNLPGCKKFMMTKPFGEHLEAKKHGLKTVLTSFKDVANTLKLAHSRFVWHRNICYKNIIVHEGHGYLTGWSVASAMFLEKHDFTGNMLFSSLRIMDNFINLKKRFSRERIDTLKDDIEALFYTFVYVACDGDVLWKRELADWHIVASLKLYTMCRDFDRQLDRAYPEFRPFLVRFRNLLFQNNEVKQVDIDKVIELFQIV